MKKLCICWAALIAALTCSISCNKYIDETQNTARAEIAKAVENASFPVYFHTQDVRSDSIIRSYAISVVARQDFEAWSSDHDAINAIIPFGDFDLSKLDSMSVLIDGVMEPVEIGDVKMLTGTVGAMKIKIRGASSISKFSEPLYVIDGAITGDEMLVDFAKFKRFEMLQEILPLREVEANLADFAGRSFLRMGYVGGKARLLSVDQVLFSMSDGHEGDRDYYLVQAYPVFFDAFLSQYAQCTDFD